LLQSKYKPPRLQGPDIARAELEKYVRGSQQKPLTILCSGAGYGKSCLMTRWYEILSTEMSSHCAWLSIDLIDNAGEFEMQGLLNALASSKPALDGTDALLSLNEKTGLKCCLDVISFLDECNTQITFFIDDYHLLTSSTANQNWLYFATHLPANVNLILGTRTMPDWPVSRMQTEGSCKVIGADRLRFSVTETSKLALASPNVNIDENQAYALNSFARGWPIALKLVFSNLKQSDDRQHVNSAIHGKNPLLLEYAEENILKFFGESTRRFINLTVYLEGLQPDLCNAVCNITDAKKVLESLEQANIVFPWEGRPGWFKYLPILHEYFKEELAVGSAESIKQLHRSAEAWFRDQGYATEALTHALAIPDYEKAILLLEKSGGDLITTGSFRVLFDFYDQIPMEIIDRNPHLIYPHLWLLVITQEFHQAQNQLDKFYKLTEKIKDPLKKIVANSSPELIKVLEFRIRQALEPEWQDVSVWQELKQSIKSTDTHVRSQLELCLARSFLRNERFAEAFATFMEARRYAELGNVPLTVITSTVRMAEIRQIEGRLDQALELCNYAIRRSRSAIHIDVPVLSVAFLLRAELFYELDQLEAAERDLVSATSRFEQFSSHIYSVQARLLAGKLACRQDGPASALQVLEVADQESTFYNHKILLHQVRSNQIRYLIMQDNLPMAKALLVQQGVGVDSRGPNPNFQVRYRERELYLGLCRYLISTGRPKDAGRWLIKLLHQSESAEKRLFRIDLMTLQAMAYWVAEDRQKALRSIREALLLGEHCGAVSTIVDEGPIVLEIIRAYRTVLDGIESKGGRNPSEGYIQLLLKESESYPETRGPISILESTITRQSNGDTKGLTSRETEILMLICDGLSNRGIAEQLVLGEGTVKWHIKNIYLKLHVSSRTQAAATARSMGLVSS